MRKLDFSRREAGGGVPIASSYPRNSSSFSSICFMISGKDRLIPSTSCSESLFVRLLVPRYLSGKSLYSGCLRKNSAYLLSATSTGTLLLISSCALLTMPMYPNFKWISSFINIFLALVPLSMMSILVMTPIVLSPALSHSLASLRPSEVERSWLAGMTHRMMVLGSLQ